MNFVRSSLSTLTQVAAAAVLSVAATAASAAPFSLTYTGSVTTVAASLAGFVSVGDTFTIDVIVDNGGTSTLSQNWTIADTVSATVRAGTYVGLWTADFYTDPSVTGFSTDATGDLTVASWFGTFDSPTSTDNLGLGARLFNGAVLASNGDLIEYRPFLGAVASWSDPVAVAAVPLPASLTLTLAGLAAVGGLRRRQQAA